MDSGEPTAGSVGITHRWFLGFPTCAGVRVFRLVYVSLAHLYNSIIHCMRRFIGGRQLPSSRSFNHAVLQRPMGVWWPPIGSPFDIVGVQSIDECAGAGSDRGEYMGLICTLSAARLSRRRGGREGGGQVCPNVATCACARAGRLGRSSRPLCRLMHGRRRRGKACVARVGDEFDGSDRGLRAQTAPAVVEQGQRRDQRGMIGGG
uniref:Uncharacterized protein n=1 Tax=Plectus sambesii TaxID=2011161 RepID=A0A914WF74_9BILA